MKFKLKYYLLLGLLVYLIFSKPNELQCKESFREAARIEAVRDYLGDNKTGLTLASAGIDWQSNIEVIDYLLFNLVKYHSENSNTILGVGIASTTISL